MGNNIGPGYLPGRIIALDQNDKCDTEGHADRLAVRRIVGECDSMGSETHCFCAECAAAEDAMPEPDSSGTCDWCKRPAQRLMHTRDIDEGMFGPVYLVCAACSSQQNKEAQEELDAAAEDDERDRQRELEADAFLENQEDDGEELSPMADVETDELIRSSDDDCH